MPTYEPIASVKAGDEPPTIRGLLGLAKGARVDRLCLVRRAKPEKGEEVQVLILLTSQKAVAAIGSWLNAVFKSFPNPDGADKHKINFDDNSSVELLHAWMNEHAQTWRWGELNGDKSTLVTVLRGKDICEKISPWLNMNECPCNLDPKEFRAKGGTSSKETPN